MKLRGPKPRETIDPRIKTYTVMISVDFLRLHPNLSRRMETFVSIREIEDVRAANNTNKKNTAPITPPNVMSLNTFGRVINIKEGPLPSAASSPPEKANTDGTMRRPARKAIAVSKSSICRTEASRWLSFFM